MKITIYTAYHKPAPPIKGAMMMPIHVGRALSATPLRGMIGDDTGDTISDRNGAFCELTALYWAWKNDIESDYIGLMHYRRVLDVTDWHQLASVEGKPERFEIDTWVSEAEPWLASNLGEYDILAPRAHVMGQSVESNYKARHEAQDFNRARAVIAADHPAYLGAFDRVAADHKVRLGNMSIMKRPLFDRYCAWLFDILFKVAETDLPRDRYSLHQARYIGFLAERLFTVFVAHESTGLRLKEVSILNLSESLMVPAVTAEMRASEDSIAIAFAADRKYLPHAAAMVRSVLDHLAPERSVDFIFLASEVGPRARAMLQEVVADRPGAVLNTVDVGAAFKDSYRSFSRAPSNATYNRFLLFDLLRGFDRLVYLDGDVIVRGDVAALYDADLGGAEIGAVTDWIMTRTLAGPTPTVDPDTPDLYTYQRDVLGMTDAQIGRYFNAGVLVIDFKAMDDAAARGAQLMKEARSGKYLFRDQDILNKVFKTRLFVLDGRWNVFNTGVGSYGRVPAAGYRKAMAAKADPLIIHYADRDSKPWDHAAVPMAQHYWQSLIRTPFYGEVISGRGPGRKQGARPGLVDLGRRLSERIPILRRPLLRIYDMVKRFR